MVGRRGLWQGLTVSAFLITGNPGSGKTTIANELSRRGLAAADTDQIAHWETTSGQPVSRSENPSDEWLLSHRWVMSRPRLEEIIQTSTAGGQRVYVCGIAANQRDMLDLFTMIFLLSIDHETQLARLNAPANAHRNAAQRAQILQGRPAFECEMRAAGAVVLDGSQPIPDLVNRILDETSNADRPQP
jgi:dephospho-CoA kinase